MNGVARFQASDRADIFKETAARMGVSATVAEKDFWVCWALGRLYGNGDLPRILFKGGTSLSKCFGLIQRFSEDIDLGIHRDALNLTEESTPSSDKGSKRQKRARKILRETTQAYVADKLFPSLETDFGQALDLDHSLGFVEAGSESVIDFNYPQALTESEYGRQDYIKPVVRLELGARSDHLQVVETELRPYAAEQFPNLFEQPACTVVAQAPERTLLEKALILHTCNVRDRTPRRTSRHAYDLFMMREHGTASDVTWDLFEQVAEHKRVYADDTIAGKAPTDGIRLVPTGNFRRGLETDYQQMEEMFFEDPPPFEEIAASLQSLQRTISGLPH